jgi:hypothetical protein
VQRCRWPLPVIVAAGIGLLPIYVVHARIVAPFGLRPTPGQPFSVDERALFGEFWQPHRFNLRYD